MQPFNRRVLVSGGLGASFGAGVSNAGPITLDTASPGAPAIIHQVFFWLKNPGSKSDRDQLIIGLNSLRTIEIIQQFYVGVPASTEKRDVVDVSYDVSELMFFKSVEDQKLYQDHPVHLRFVEGYAHLWKRVLVYDSSSV